jgi:thermostable 8-oxoguanine DNA glycosylase
MKIFTENLEYYIDQYELEKQIFQLGKEIKKRGWLEKTEFLTICLWKSRRPKKLYYLNSDKDIISKSKMVFDEKNELNKIKILTDLKGVRIPTASAILSVVNPEIYPIIDIRCVQSLRDLGIINWKTITEKNWIEYLSIIRSLSKEKNKTAREIEKGLFSYNRINLDKEYTNLYK